MRSSGGRSIVAKLGSKGLHEWMVLLDSLWPRFKSKFYYPFIFGSFGKSSVMFRPVYIGNPKYIHIGERVLIRPGVRLETVVLNPDRPPELRIGSDVNIEQDVHIVAVGKINIHDGVSLTARSSLLCGNHPFFDIHDPRSIGCRVEGEDSFIEIGEGSFLGIGCNIQMNVRIGKHVVVGSNSVVKRSVPDYCVVNGNPAEVVLQFNVEEQRWSRPKKA